MNKRRLKKARKKFWQNRPLTQEEDRAVNGYYMNKSGSLECIGYVMVRGARKFVKDVTRIFAEIGRGAD